jgi:hypothetical protein
MLLQRVLKLAGDDYRVLEVRRFVQSRLQAPGFIVCIMIPRLPMR